MIIEIEIKAALVTWKAAAWGEPSKELFRAGQEAIREAVQTSPHKGTLKSWLESGTKLELVVAFHLNNRRVTRSDLDSLLSDLFNPLVEGACGARPQGKPVPQVLDRLFWRVVAEKVESTEEKVVVRIFPYSPGAKDGTTSV